MKSNVNVFVGVVLCAVLCGMFVWLRSAGEEDTWKPNEIYDQVHSSSYGASYTNATFSGSPQDGGLAVSMSSPSSMRARHATNFYAGAGYAPTASSPLSSSVSLLPSSHGGAAGAGLYATSSAELKYFGGGGNGGAAMGGRSSMSGGSSSMAGGAGVGSLSISSPIAYSTARGGNMGGTSGGADMLAQQGAMPDMASSFGYTAASNYLNAGTYDQYNAMYGGSSTGRSNVRGKQNAPGNNQDNWLNWLAQNGNNYGKYVDGVWMLDIYALKSAYDAYCLGWNETMGGKMPTWDEWLAWFMGSEDDPYGWTDDGGDTYTYYKYVPIGDVMSLVLFALLYAVVLIIRRKKATLRYN